MKTITLQFQTPQDLSGFRKMAVLKIIEVQIKELRLACECSMLDLEKEINYYGAKIIDTPTT
jgi:hypothetical protein